MTERTHLYRVHVEWTGNQGSGTSGYKDYSRNHAIGDPDSDKAIISGSSDPAFRGEVDRWNPENLLVASLSACHKLWYLHLCAVGGVVVTAYRDEAVGEMVEGGDGGGRFTQVTLHPVVTLATGSDAENARALHEKAHAMCFISNSVNFPVRCEPQIQFEA